MILACYHPTMKANILGLDNVEGVQHGSVWVTLKNQC